MNLTGAKFGLPGSARIWFFFPPYTGVDACRRKHPAGGSVLICAVRCFTSVILLPVCSFSGRQGHFDGVRQQESSQRPFSSRLLSRFHEAATTFRRRRGVGLGTLVRPMEQMRLGLVNPDYCNTRRTSNHRSAIWSLMPRSCPGPMQEFAWNLGVVLLQARTG